MFYLLLLKLLTNYFIIKNYDENVLIFYMYSNWIVYILNIIFLVMFSICLLRFAILIITRI